MFKGRWRWFMIIPSSASISMSYLGFPNCPDIYS
jgi:hypothetical protein